MTFEFDVVTDLVSTIFIRHPPYIRVSLAQLYHNRSDLSTINNERQVAAIWLENGK